MLIILLMTILLILHNGDNITFFNGVFENVEGVALFFDCLGSHFTWLQSIFTSFPPLLNLVSRMKCVTGICPKDFEDYGCACRFEMEGFPVDEVDGCCFQHRKCYEDATEEECTWDPAKVIMDISCLTKNITCAIECFLRSPINSSLNNFDASLCSSLVTAVTQKDATVAFDNSVQRGLSESYFATIRATTTSPEINITEAEFIPASEFSRPANRGKCCFSHQCCLEQVKRLGCQPEKNPRSEVVCFDHTPTCVGWSLCENLLCSCDKAAAECMAAAPFNESWKLPGRPACQEDKLACRGVGRERPPGSPPRGARTSSEEEEESSSEEADLAQPLLRRGKRAIRH
ncbi:otoconin-90, partial [Protobothrops mucrosquamatus]|uniref:otoconin-90 n=1 Tax=Protobothrops mucrosquamatus TaxID=103944 RepID=UPI000775901A